MFCYETAWQAAGWSAMSEATNPTAIPLITNDDNGRFQVHEEAVEILNAIEAPLAIIAVAGMWRTGKSFLLNSLLGLNGKPDSFVVGNTVHACTKGLWLWGAPIKLPDGLNVLFVDSEGLARSASGANPGAYHGCWRNLDADGTRRKRILCVERRLI